MEGGKRESRRTAGIRAVRSALAEARLGGGSPHLEYAGPMALPRVFLCPDAATFSIEKGEARGTEDDQNGPHVVQQSGAHRSEQSPPSGQHGARVEQQTENQIETNDQIHPLPQPNQKGKHGEIVPRQHHIGGFQGHVRASRPHGHTHVGHRQGGTVVDAVSDKQHR